MVEVEAAPARAVLSARPAAVTIAATQTRIGLVGGGFGEQPDAGGGPRRLTLPILIGLGTIGEVGDVKVGATKPFRWLDIPEQRRLPLAADEFVLAVRAWCGVDWYGFAFGCFGPQEDGAAFAFHEAAHTGIPLSK